MLNVEPRGLFGLLTKKTFGKKKGRKPIQLSSHLSTRTFIVKVKARQVFFFLELVAMILNLEKIIYSHAPLQQVQVGMVKLNQADWSSNPGGTDAKAKILNNFLRWWLCR